MQSPPGHDPQQNPYLPPQGAPPGTPQAAGGPPKWFQLATIATMVMGALGMLAGIWAPINLLIVKSNPTFGVPAGGGMAPEMAEMQEKILAASMPELTASLGVVNLITGAFALYTAIQLARLQPGARLAFRKALLALGVYEILAIIVGLVMQIRMVGMMKELMSTAMRSGGGTPPPGFEQGFGAAMQVAMLFGLVAAVVWAGCKIFFAFWARAYADKPEVIAHAG